MAKMFNVIRPEPGPDCSKDYHREEVIRILQKIFYGKCYLCEDEVSMPVIDHFIPHRGNKNLEYNWDNLFYSCYRCNNIKAVDENILDCCDNTLNISKSIKCLCQSVIDADIQVEAQNDDLKTINTAKLLFRCYNERNTGERSISRELLHEKIYYAFTDFVKYRRILKSKNSTENMKKEAVNHLADMAKDSYPFSIFWKWHIKSDSYLVNNYKELVNATGL